MKQNNISSDKLLEIINVQTEVVQQGMNLSSIMDLVTQRTFEDKKINLGASMGYALFSEDGTDLDVLIEKADKSMYELKRGRKGLGKVR